MALNAYPQAQHVMERVIAAEQQRLSRWGRAQQAYYGQLPPALIPKPNKPNDNVQINYGRLFVDKGVSFLFGKEVGFELDETKNTAEEEYLKLQWKRNKKMRRLHDIGVNGGIYGHPFVQMQILPEKDGRKQTRLIVIDPMEVNVRWNPNDIEDVLWFHIRGEGIDEAGKPIDLRQRIERDGAGGWHTVEEQRPKAKHGETDNPWELVKDTAWPYPFPPIVHSQNLPAPNEFWGISDLEEDVVDLIKAINFVLSNLRKIIRYHGHPKTIGTGFTQQQIKLDTDELLILPNSEARLFNLEMAGNLESSLEFFRTLKEALFTESRMPEIALGSMQGVGALSGVALEILYQPLLDKTETKRLLYGELLQEICARMLVIGGFRQSVDDVEVRVTWPEILPRDMVQERQMLQIDRELGIVSKDTAATKLGYSYEIEQEKRKKEQAEETPPQLTPPTQPPAQPGQPIAATANEERDAEPAG
jgi:hypothetical protein